MSTFGELQASRARAAPKIKANDNPILLRMAIVLVLDQFADNQQGLSGVAEQKFRRFENTHQRTCLY